MAILFNTLGKLSGSMGNVTARRHYEKSEKTIMSQKANEVANPKSIGQAQQRLKLSPITKIYSRLQSIASHSFQGLGTGMANYAEFLKINTNDFNGPYCIKGESEVVAGPLMISRGSLIGFDATKESDLMAGFKTGVKLGMLSISGETTLGELSAAIIENNSGVQNNDQLTFVGCVEQGETFRWNFLRLVLDKNSIAKLEDSSLAELLSSSSDELMYSVFTNTAEDSLNVICGGTILSHLDPTSKKWQRSTCRLKMFSYSPTYFGADAYKGAVDSYTGKTATIPTSSEWYLNGGTYLNKFGFYAVIKDPKSVAIGSDIIRNLAMGVSLNGKNKMLVTPLATGKRNVYTVANGELVESTNGYTDEQLNLSTIYSELEIKEIAPGDLDQIKKIVH